MLDENAEGFGAERFPQENRVVADLMKKIGDLEGDERALPKETQALSEKQEAETGKRLRGQLAEFVKRERKGRSPAAEAWRLKTGDPESALAEEVERARDSASRSSGCSPSGIWPRPRTRRSAPPPAWTAPPNTWMRTPRSGSREAQRSRSASGDERQEVGEARALAQEIADDVRKLLPAPRRR